MSQIKLTPEDRILFSKIASDIKNNSSDYQEVGELLDKYCTKDSFRKRTKEYKTKLEEDLKEFNFPLEDELEVVKFMLEADIYLSPYDIKLNEDGEVDSEASKKIIENSKGYNDLYIYTWRDTIWYLLGNWNTTPNLGIKKYRLVLLMTWILTDPDLETGSKGINITKFEKMPMEKRQRLYQETFVNNESIAQQWMKVIKVAWARIEAEKEVKPKMPIEPGRRNSKAEGTPEPPPENQSHVFNIQNSNVICGDVKAKNVQTENHSRIQKHIGTEKKKKGFIKKLLGIIGAIIVAIIAAMVVDILGRFGWFERIYSIFQPK